MNIKTKLQLGFGLLFVIVIGFGGLALYFMNQISASAGIILKDNYETLRYTREMRRLLDQHDLPLPEVARGNFQRALGKEARNVTEPGEKEAVKKLQQHFGRLIVDGLPMREQSRELRSVRAALLEIETINMDAIVRKNEVARKAVNHAGTLLGFTGAFTFLVLFSFSVNFPGFIANPLRELVTGISDIARKNYKTRLHYRQNDEFGQVAVAFNDMATKLDEWQNSNLADIISQKRRIEALIEQVSDAIIGVDENERLLFINTAARKILHIGDETLEGKSITELAPGNELFESIRADEAPGKLFRIVVDGKDSHFQLTTRQIVVPDLVKRKQEPLVVANQSAGKVFILTNITTFKEKDEAKTNFIATISHELKTPIAAIKMSTQLLSDGRVGGLNEEQQQLVKHIGEDSNRLLKITSELLDLSQVETGNIRLSFIPASPTTIIEYAVNAVAFEAAQKNVSFETDVPAGTPNLLADLEKTTWILINFLSNALRYSPAGSTIFVSATQIGQSVEIAVRDRGKGIEERYKERLFERYFQVPADGQNKSGSGLGLAISKDFITAQGGTIGVESEVGEGSRFWFRLPSSKG